MYIYIKYDTNMKLDTLNIVYAFVQWSEPQ